MVERMRLVTDALASEEAFADEFSDEAVQAERVGDADTALVMRDLARRHRVEALKLDGRLAAMRRQYAVRFG